ncbi:stage II sporulation protein M [Paenibacillus alkaliterrae]|uniref:stage II sporulation protein M n=1 Tax=Paenibacillus alkaliterrae TaxID=320909 RepID=UPI001F2CD32D|nr:stage II sporulation protein M [Paenibacillus alkaliterrae]MCF2937537.1 stage II sporulation protein M [Paenibacillus alkaliterrae]
MIKNQLSLYVFVSVLFVVGVIFGALMVNALTLEQQQELARDIDQYVQLMNAGIGTGDAASFWERFIFHSKWLIILWLLGITVVGIPGVLALNFLKGALVGFSVGTLINQYAWKGVLFSLVSIAPQNILAVPAMIIASAAAISFSMFVIKNRLLQQKGDLAPQLGSFTSTAMLMLIIFAGAALFEAYLSPSLISWVSPLLLPADPHYDAKMFDFPAG